MASIQGILNMGLGALQAHQLGVTVTSHNVANVNTPGYSRQRLLLEEGRPRAIQCGQVGTGVQPATIQRVYDRFLGAQLRESVSSQSFLASRAAAYERMEALFADLSGTDLATELQAFWAAWEDLSTHPEGGPERGAVAQAGVQLAQRVRGLAQGLDGLGAEMEQAVRLSLGPVNDLSGQIGDLNAQILRAEAGGHPANDLRDMRDQRLEELSALLEVQSWEDEGGMLTVLAPGGSPLVMGTRHWDLMSRVTAPGRSSVLWTDDHGNELDITGEIQQGTIGGYLQARDQTIPQLRASLDAWARALIWETNLRQSVASGTGPGVQASSLAAVPPGVSLAASGLPWASEIRDGEIHLWVYDDSEPPLALGRLEVTVDAATSLQDLADRINADPDNGGRLLASVSPDGRLELAGQGGFGFAVSSDTSNALAAIGYNGLFTGSHAGDMAVSPSVLGDPSTIGSGRAGDADGAMAPGDNRAALAMAALRDMPLLGGSTLEGAYATLVGSLGAEAAGTYRHAEYADAVVRQIRDQQSSVAGVSLDEEMVRLMESQWAYEAAAKMIQAGREMLQTVSDLLR
jgi:flagellar hook-associated protein 1 FlgK